MTIYYYSVIIAGIWCQPPPLPSSSSSISWVFSQLDYRNCLLTGLLLLPLPYIVSSQWVSRVWFCDMFQNMSDHVIPLLQNPSVTSYLTVKAKASTGDYKALSDQTPLSSLASPPAFPPSPSSVDFSLSNLLEVPENPRHVASVFWNLLSPLPGLLCPVHIGWFLHFFKVSDQWSEW